MKRPFSALLSDYLDGTLPASEVEDFFSQVGENRELLAGVIDERAEAGALLPEHTARTARMMKRLEAALDDTGEKRTGRTGVLLTLSRWGWAAAAFVGVLVGGFYLWHAVHGKKDGPGLAVAQHINVAPGHDGAILTLSNGIQVVLDSMRNGVIAAQKGANVILQDGRLAYDPTGKQGGGPVYNTMTTPRGRQFQLTLPDGTKVWLNAESSIKYPTAFTGTERSVEMKGEAYFEVAKHATMPFRVHVDGREDIEVLGTSFNVNAYADEQSLNTTLLEGSIRVRAQNGDNVLKPGQQAQMGSDIKIVDNRDLDKVMAWKNGAFNFEGLSLEEAMRQLERWYDIKVRYEHGVPDVHFGGKIGRDVSLDDLLQMLSGTKLKFRMEKGRELVIMQ